MSSPKNIVLGSIYAIIAGLTDDPRNNPRVQAIIDQLPDLTRTLFNQNLALSEDARAHLRASLHQADCVAAFNEYIAALEEAERDLSELDLSGVTLPGAALEGVNLQFADFSNADLAARHGEGDAPEFKTCDLRGASFAGAKLSYGSLSNCLLDGANFTNAALDWSAFSGGALRGANFAGADFAHAQFHNVDFSDADLSQVKNLRNTLAPHSASLIFNRHTKLPADAPEWMKEACRVARQEGGTGYARWVIPSEQPENKQQFAGKTSWTKDEIAEHKRLCSLPSYAESIPAPVPVNTVADWESPERNQGRGRAS